MSRSSADIPSAPSPDSDPGGLEATLYAGTPDPGEWTTANPEGDADIKALVLPELVRENRQVFRIIAPVVALLGLVLWISSLDPLQDSRGLEFFRYLSLGISALSLLMTLATYLGPRPFRNSRLPYIAYAFLLMECAVSFTVRDFMAGDDLSGYILGTWAMGIVLSAPWQAYVAGNALALGGLVTGQFLVNPEKTGPGSLLVWTSYAVLACLISLLLEQRRVRAITNRLLLDHANRKLTTLSFTDPLTGLYNRRFFTEILRKDVAISRRMTWPLSLIVADVDHFKKVNDTLGHDAGDIALKVIARTLRDCTRDSDICTRFGGEEFAIILPQTPPDKAMVVAQRIRERLASTEIPDIPWHLSLSMGLACLETGMDGPGLFRRADDLMYQAKQAGRNCIQSVAIPDPPPEG